MDKKDPMQALESFYRAAEKAEVPAGIECRKPRTALRKPGIELLKVASACAAGIAVACFFALPGTPGVPAIPATTSGGNSLREQMVRSGLNPDEVLGVNERRSQIEREDTWHV
jgi:hypothetical protein